MPDTTPKGAPKPRKKRNIDTPEGDFYPTQEWATRAFLDHQPFSGTIWDPACGDGRLLEVARREFGYEVAGTDITDRGYGHGGIDFLAQDEPADNIVTNPPFHLAESFVLHGLRLARRRLALLVRLEFQETLGRYFDIFATKRPTTFWVYAERPSFYPATDTRVDGGTTGYGWAVWDMEQLGRHTIMDWIAPGYDPNGAVAKGKFRPGDARALNLIG